MDDEWRPIPRCGLAHIGGSDPIRLAHYITLSSNTLCRDASLAFGVEDDEARDLPRTACTKEHDYNSMREMEELTQAASRARECGKPDCAKKWREWTGERKEEPERIAT